jgi:hypothetical protein
MVIFSISTQRAEHEGNKLLSKSFNVTEIMNVTEAPKVSDLSK